MPDGRVTILPFSREELRALVDGSLRRQQNQVKFREQIGEINRVEDPAQRAWRQHELLISVACGCVGASPDDFPDLTAAAAIAGSIAALVANLDRAAELGKNKGQRPAATALALWASQRVVEAAAPFGATPTTTRRPYEWLMETVAGGAVRYSRRAAESAALSVWFFEGGPPGVERSMADDGKWLTPAARDIAAELKRRGITRTPSELIRYREDIDCDNHLTAIRDRQPVEIEAAFARLSGWQPVEPPKPGARRKTQPMKQRFYEQLWPFAELHLNGLIANGYDRHDAAWLTVEVLVLGWVAPAPAGLSVRATNIARRHGAAGGSLGLPENPERN